MWGAGREGLVWGEWWRNLLLAADRTATYVPLFAPVIKYTVLAAMVQRQVQMIVQTRLEAIDTWAMTRRQKMEGR